MVRAIHEQQVPSGAIAPWTVAARWVLKGRLGEIPWQSVIVAGQRCAAGSGQHKLLHIGRTLLEGAEEPIGGRVRALRKAGEGLLQRVRSIG